MVTLNPAAPVRAGAGDAVAAPLADDASRGVGLPAAAPPGQRARTALRNAAGSVLAGRSLTCPSPSSMTRQVPSARRGQVGGDERQAERADQRGIRGRADLRRQVSGSVGVRRHQAAGSAGPPGAGFGGGEPLEPAQHETAREFLLAQHRRPRPQALTRRAESLLAVARRPDGGRGDQCQRGYQPGSPWARRYCPALVRRVTPLAVSASANAAYRPLASIQPRYTAPPPSSRTRATARPAPPGSASASWLARATSCPASLAAAASAAKCSSARRGRSGPAGTRSSTTPVCATTGCHRTPITDVAAFANLRAPNAEYLWPTLRTPWRGPCTQMVQFCAVVVAEQTLSSRHESASVIGPDGIVVSSALGPRADVSCPRHRTCATACCAQSCRFVARSVTASASAAMVLACTPQSLPGGVPCRWGRFLVLLEPTVNPVGSVLFGPAGTRKVRLR